MPRPSTAPVRKQVSLPAETARAIEEYRFANRIGAESEAIRRLIDAGLKAASRCQATE
jgi:hypothetical protein